MSCSDWALAETWRRGVSVHGVGEHCRLDGRLRRERRLLPSAVSATKYTVLLLAAGILVLAVEPARALAAPARRADPAHASTPAVHPANPVVLAFGSGYGGGASAVAVRALQDRLDSVGDSPGPIDGRYGPRTERAVQRFQSAHGLRVDGIAGPVTLAALRAPSTVFYPGAGDSGHGSGGVRGLQLRLRRDGYSPGPIDGRYGPLTTGAVRRFQAAHGLGVDGIAGPRTFRELKIVPAPRRPAAHPTPGPRPKTVSRSRRRRTTVPKRSRPSTRQATRPKRATRPTGATRPKGSSWPVVLVLAVLIGLATLAGGVWLVGRRRRGLATVEPRPVDGGTVTTTPVEPAAVKPAPVEAAAVEAAAVEPPPVEPPPVEPPPVEPPPVETAAVEPAAVEPGAVEAEDLPQPQPESTVRAGLDSGVEAERAVELGFRLLEQGDVEGAERAYRSADELGDVAAASNLGVLLEHRGDLAGAEAAYRRADAGGSADGAFNLAALLVERGEMEEAIAAYHRADQRGDGAAAADLGVLLEQGGDMAGAEAAYRRADARQDPGGALNLGVLLEGRGELEHAAAAYERAEARGDPTAPASLGMLLERIGDYPGAAQAYSRAAERGHAHGALRLGVLLERWNDPQGALRAYQQAQACDHPEIAAIARERALALSRGEERRW